MKRDKFPLNQTNEDIIEQRVKGEKRLLSGMIRTSYDSVLKFSLAFVVGLFCLGFALTIISLTVGVIVASFYNFTGWKLALSLFLTPASIVLGVLVWKVFRRLIKAFLESEKSFKIKSLLAISVPLIIFLLITAAMLYAFWDYFIVS